MHAKDSILFEGVSYRYADQAPWILKDLNLEVSPGEFLMLLGPSGCGKTTALNLAAGFDFPVEGAVRVDGQPVAAPGADRAVIFQGDDSIYPWLTTAQNVEMPLRVAGLPKSERTDLVRRHLELVGLDEHADKYPHQLSGGMRQRVQIARALVMPKTKFLLMDEPFGALDAQTKSLLQDELGAIWERTRKTVLFITHDIAEAIILGDRVAVMTYGPAACVKEIIDIDLPRPRRRSDPQFGVLYERIWSMISARVAGH